VGRTLLPAAELLDLLLLVHHLGVERHRDSDARVALHARGRFLAVRLVRVVVAAVLFIPRAAVRLALDHEPPVACGNQLLKDCRELARDLLECALDRLVLLLVQVLDQGLDGFLGRVELFAPLQELVALACEAVVLVKGLFVDVLVLFEGLVDLAQPRLNLGVVSASFIYGLR